jgi:hypothetical protein
MNRLTKWGLTLASEFWWWMLFLLPLEYYQAPEGTRQHQIFYWCLRRLTTANNRLEAPRGGRTTVS